MTYRVVWSRAGFQRLLCEWNAAGTPESGIRAFDVIENALRTDAHTKGESRGRDRRILIEAPLGVVFEARQDTGEAVILDAWIVAPRRY